MTLSELYVATDSYPAQPRESFRPVTCPAFILRTSNNA
jgi:hypothetical protein